jgi:hypothetical protein
MLQESESLIYLFSSKPLVQMVISSYSNRKSCLFKDCSATCGQPPPRAPPRLTTGTSLLVASCSLTPGTASSTSSMYLLCLFFMRAVCLKPLACIAQHATRVAVRVFLSESCVGSLSVAPSAHALPLRGSSLWVQRRCAWRLRDTALSAQHLVCLCLSVEAA